MRVSSFRSAVAIATALMGAAGAVQAQVLPEGLEIKGAPIDGAKGFQTTATSLMRDIVWLDSFLIVVITVITLFVIALLGWCILRFNQKANPEPATFTHNQPLEVTWTIVPAFILVGIGFASLPILFDQQQIPEADVTIKTTGYQWYWGYEYPDHGIEFDSYMLQRDELEEFGYSQDEYRLATDTAMVVPTGKTIVVQVTGGDVIHSWAMPAFGVKQDAVPGRLAELWFEVDEGAEGIYFGQCSELCGLDHAYMPITVVAVSQADYEIWLEGAIEEFAGTPRNLTVAAAE